MAKAAEVMKAGKKKYGDRTITMGITMYEAARIPFGVFELDYATGGGVPRGRLTEIYGVESSCKTNLALKVIGNAQKMEPDSKAVFIDAENASDGKWMGRMGVDVDGLIYIRPDYGEQVIEMCEKLLEAEDVSVVVIDSTAALVGINELEADVEKVTPGNATQLIQRLVKRAVGAMSRAEKAYEEGERKTLPPAFIMINQVRMKIGVMFGSPESTPGGMTPKFAAALRIRSYGKNVMDAKISKAMPVIKNLAIGITKWKVPIISTVVEFDMAMIAHNGFKVGETKSWNKVEGLLKHFGMLVKDPKAGWWLNTDGSAAKDNGLFYKTLTELHDLYDADYMFRTAVQGDLFKAGVTEMENMGDEGEIDESAIPVEAVD